MLRSLNLIPNLPPQQTQRGFGLFAGMASTHLAFVAMSRYQGFFIKLQNKPKKVWNKIRDGDINVCKSLDKIKPLDLSFERFHPLRVVLFGSRARGDEHKESAL
jgi:hypothetical protein